MKKKSLKQEIREQTGKCVYCEKNQVDWFCPECYWGTCEECIEQEYMGKCMGECWDLLPDVITVELDD